MKRFALIFFAVLLLVAASDAQIVRSRPLFVPASGGGPVAYYAAVLTDGSGSTNGTDPWDSSSFSPTAGRRLVALVYANRDGGAVDMGSNLAISDSQSMTWTSVGSVSTGDGVLGLRAFISTAVPSSTSTTVTLDCGSGDVLRYRVSIFEVTGTDGTTAGFTSNGAAATDGSDSLTLAATPTADDLCVYMRVRAATGGFIIGSSYTEVVDADFANVGIGIAVNDDTTSTTVSITDARDGGSSASDNIHLAFIIRAG